MNIPVLSVYDAQGNEIPIPAIMGPPGQDGSDAEVTAENIAAALGYTPAEIDDTAGDGDTDKTWSADKLVEELDGKIDDSFRAGQCPY